MGHKNPTLPQYFFLCPVFRQLWVFFHFLTQLMGAFPPNRFRVRIFSSDSQPSKGSAHGSVHENLHLLHEGNHVLSVQSFPVRSVRVHWTDYCRNRSNTTDFSSPENGFSQWIIITQGYLHSFFTFVLDEGWIYSWERMCFLWLSRFSFVGYRMTLVSGTIEYDRLGIPHSQQIVLWVDWCVLRTYRALNCVFCRYSAVYACFFH